jgi:hypothetical protein
MAKNCEPCRQIKITTFNDPLADEIKNIAAHKGITKTAYIKPLIKTLLGYYPDYMKAKQPERKKRDESPYMILRGTAENAKEQLNNVANFMGVDLSDLIKVKVAEHNMAIPAHMKTPFIDD